MVPAELFKANEVVFFLLIHKDKRKYEMLEDFGYKHTQFTRTMRDVFNQKPNDRNLRSFFNNPAIRFLWRINEINDFSESVRQELSAYSPEDRSKIYRHLANACPEDFQILP